MSWGRVIGTAAAAAAVAAGTALVIGMGRAQPKAQATGSPQPTRSATTYPHYAGPAPVRRATANASTSATATSSAATATGSAATTAAGAPATSTTPTPQPATSATSAAPPPPPPPRSTPTTSSRAVPPPQRGGALPLGFSTGNATRVITVTAGSPGSTTAWLQAWQQAPGGGWLQYGPGVTAHVGSAGLTTSPSEFRSATPIGSFTLTRSFGALSNPGTPLPYAQTNGSYWWISQSGPLYNTMQTCWSNCPFTQGSPNEHLYYETPYYNYAVVIDTPSGSSAYPHGSAFFLHVTDGGPTAGCVAIPQSKLVQLMQWLTPSAHPRILIGVT